MVDAALNVTAEQIVEYSAYGELLRGTATGARPRRPRACTSRPTPTRTARRRWVAVAVATDEQWEALAGRARASRPGRPIRRWPPRPAVGRPRRHRRPSDGLVHARRRRDRRVACGRPASRWPRSCSRTSRPTLLQLPVRGFFEDGGAPGDGAGPPPHAADPVLRGPARFHRRPAPLLGEHNDEVLGGLGCTPRGHRRARGGGDHRTSAEDEMRHDDAQIPAHHPTR